MNRLLTLIIGLMILSGCTTIRKQALDANNAAALKDQTIAITTYPKPDFAAMTPVKAALGMIGAFAAISDGNQLIEKYKVGDPALIVSNDLATALENRLGVKRITTPLSATDDDVSKIAALASPSSQYVLDVKTFLWSMNYFATDWTHYRIFFTARARLINANTKAVVAEGFCKHIPESNTNAPTYDELMANDGARLKLEQKNAANSCVDTLQNEMFAFSTAAASPTQSTIARTQAITSPVQPTAERLVVSPAPATTEKSLDLPMQNTVPQQNEPVVASTTPTMTPVTTPTTTPTKSSSAPTYEKIETIPFRLGTSSFTVERMAKEAGCVGTKGAGLVSPIGSVEVYKMSCEAKKDFVAKCVLRQCTRVQ
ncbi:hypothetical protein [Undibacterium sp. Di24W]|uniref:hypothetical protein n=1 Tax=Undibacterium sp. Di24W TaxID=3413033 RepID=UPI003BF1937B